MTLNHPALVHRSLDEFLDHVVPFVREGALGGFPTVVAVGHELAGGLRQALGKIAASVVIEDTRRWYPHPATRLRAFHTYVTDRLREGASRINLVGEPVWPEGPPEFLREWVRYESILNAILRPFPVTLLCTYDGAILAPEIIRFAACTHPMVRDGVERPSDTYEDPARLLEALTPDLDPLGRGAENIPTRGQIDDLAEVRRLIGSRAQDAGVGPSRRRQLELAVTEVVTNAIRHGGGPTLITTWSDDQRFACDIEDAGGGFEDPFAGYRPPTGEQLDGYGLWLTRQSVDLLQIRSGRDGTKARIHMLIDSQPGAGSLAS